MKNKRRISLDSIMRECHYLLKRVRKFRGGLNDGLQLNSRLLDFYNSLVNLEINGDRALEAYCPTFELMKNRLDHKISYSGGKIA